MVDLEFKLKNMSQDKKMLLLMFFEEWLSEFVPDSDYKVHITDNKLVVCLSDPTDAVLIKLKGIPDLFEECCSTEK